MSNSTPSTTSGSTPPQDEYAAARTYLEHLFDTDSSQVSCLSVLPHDLKNVHDLQAHFFGCLDLKKRVEVLDKADHEIWAQAKKLELEDTQLHARSSIMSPDPNQNADADQLDMRYITALNLQAELKRIKVLRRTPALHGLVKELRDSIKTWRNEHKADIEMVGNRRENSHAWHEDVLHSAETRSTGYSVKRLQVRTESSAISRPPPRRQITTVEDSRQELDKDLGKFSDKLKEIIAKKPRKSERESGQESEDDNPYDVKRDIKARLVKLERPDATISDGGSFMANVMEPLNENVDDKIYKGSFPDQRVSVFHLLESKFKRRKKKEVAERKLVAAGMDKTTDQATYDMALSDMLRVETVCPSELRYFHIPANNMSWVEEAIAGYFNESFNEADTNFDLCPKTKLVLQDGCWRGQEHNGGPGSVVHTRNLRPMCEKIPTDIENLYRSDENTQKGIVLFMPFLHWETDRRRNLAATLIEQLADEHDLDEREMAEMWKTKRQEDHAALHTAQPPAHPSLDYMEPDYYRPRGLHKKEILAGLAEMLWVKIGDGKTMPSGLTHALWQNIRDENYANSLLVALEKAISERLSSGPAALPTILRPSPSPFHSETSGGGDDTIQSIFFETVMIGTTARTRLRDWKDILWGIKAAGRGHPTPHALEDIFWGEIKRARQRGDFFKHETTIFQGIDMDEHKHLQPKDSLAKVLVRAARLYEQMKTYPDQRIMEEYLFKHPPLHPRRTLDQAYFWRLRNTRLRDRDQVVYRYTNAEFAHTYRPQPPSDQKNDRSRASAMRTDKINIFRKTKTETGPENWTWTRHGEYERKNGCDQCEEDIRKVPRAIMVDQLWIWVLDKDTILTCFPQRYGMSEKDPSGVHQSIRLRIKARSNPDNHVLSIFDLALIILDECFDTFFNRTRTPDKRPQAMDMFAESIGRVTNKQAIAFQHLWQLSKRLTEIYMSGVEDKVHPELLLALLNVTPEAELQREIRDIIDELDIILHIARQQQVMIARFVKFAVQITKSDLRTQRKTARALDKEMRTLRSRSPNDSQVAKMVDRARQSDRTAKLLEQQREAFKMHSDDLLVEIDDRIAELSALKSSAESTAQNVNDLLSLKQQQASVVQAYEAMKQGEETVRQGKAIMVFTVMTIVFLPLSFMSSLFGMNAVELTGNDPSPGTSASTNSSNSSGAVPDEIIPFYPTTFKRQVLVMFTVSFGAVLLVIVPAFSPFIRASYSAIFNHLVARFITSTGLYMMWLKSGLRSKKVRDDGRNHVSKMKKNVREALARQKLLQSEIRDKVRKAGGLEAGVGGARETSNGVAMGDLKGSSTRHREQSLV